jgi:hypothetical protein
MIEDLKISGEQMDLYKAAIKICRKSVKSGKAIKDAVAEMKDKFSGLGLIADMDLLEKVLYQEVTQEGSTHPVIATPEVRTRDWWTKIKDKIKTYYWDRYYSYMESKPGWSITSLIEIDNSTDEVMNAIANPTLGIADERRGLVYGDVQSGKTAHYIGLINKAYSAGYKIIIVLTGMHNSLRSQTQSRIDEEVLGYETSSQVQFNQQTRNVIGVGNVISNSQIGALQSLTNRDEKGDFNNKIAIASFLPPYVIITKKNSKILNNILRTLKKSTIAIKSESGDKVIPAKYPALIIDDEADQASINTNDMNKKDTPSSINGKIRSLLNLFECKSYVGYTATPFANIFIPHRTDDDVYGKDLFPKDFIARSPRPSLYIGAREFFGLGDEEIKPLPLTEYIETSEPIKKDSDIIEIPKELKKAIKFFLISTAVRNLRGQRNKPNTMLVHMVRYIEQQKKLKKKIYDYVHEEIFNYINGNDQEIENDFKDIYTQNYVKTTKELKKNYSRYTDGCEEFAFDVVWNEIKRIVRANELDIWTVNGKSEDSLIYKNWEGQPFNVIAIGGDKLSRGLTLEGLTISYFTRTASAMDTLMQMGRWFGYRPGYLDLCRLFTTQELYNNYEIIAYSVDNLISQFDEMNLQKSDPEHFGLKIATDPHILISARNKIRTGTDYQSDFSNSMTQTRLMDADQDIIEENYNAVDELLSSLDQNRLDSPQHKADAAHDPRNTPKGKYFWTQVPGSKIADFFERYHTSKAATKASSQHIADYIREMNRCDGLTDWTICLCGVNGQPTSKIATKSAYGPIKARGVERNVKNNQAKYDSTTRDLHVLTSGGDEELDYTIAMARKADKCKSEWKKKSKNHQLITREVRREVRDFNHGFLLLYPIESAADDIKTVNERAPYGFAVVFPDRRGKGTLKSYKLNEVAAELELEDYE